MKDGNKIRVLMELQVIPGVGEKTAEDLWELGIRSVKDLKGKDPEGLQKMFLQSYTDAAFTF